jgi:hypothetical protein
MNAKLAKRIRKHVLKDLPESWPFPTYETRQFKQVHAQEVVDNDVTGKPFLSRDTAEPITQDVVKHQPQPIRLVDGSPRQRIRAAKALAKAQGFGALL